MIEETKTESMHNSKRIKHLLISFVVAIVIVGWPLVGVYMTGGGNGALALIALIVLALPGYIYWLLSSVGLLPALRGRQHLIESNPTLWIFCVIFYTLFIYSILRWRHGKNMDQINMNN